LKKSHLAIALLIFLGHAVLVASVPYWPEPARHPPDYRVQADSYVMLGDVLLCLALGFRRAWIASATALAWAAFLFWGLLGY